MVSRNSDFSLHKYVFGLVLAELAANILRHKREATRAMGEAQ